MEETTQQVQQVNTETSITTTDTTAAIKEMRFILTQLPKFMPANQLRKIIADRLQLAPSVVSCKKAPKWEHALLTLKAEDAQDILLVRLNALQLKGGLIKADVDDGTVRSLAKSGKVLKRAPAGERCLNDQVTPLWQVPYEEQLALKQKAMQEIIDQVEVKAEGLEVSPILASPLTTGYRNKCEFSFGFDAAGEPCLGFTLGGFREGTVTVANARECVHVPEAMLDLADAVQAHVRERKELAPVFDRAAKQGFWRIMMVRLHEGKMMIVMQAQDGTLTPEQVGTEVELVKKLLRDFTSNGVTVGSAFFQLSAAVHHGMDPKAVNRLLFGSETLIEELDGLRFQISQGSFFQVNKPATLVLYSAIREAVLADGIAGDTVLLDLCCGTGTIGMMMAPHVSRVIGVEMVPEAVEDAKRNAALNGIANIDFRCAKVEDALPGILAELPASARLAVVLDPPRSGLHKSVIKTIRNTERISGLVFVSCNPKACLQNFADLGKEVSRATSGKPFALSSALPVDMFPMTEHCELVLKFNRV